MPFVKRSALQSIVGRILSPFENFIQQSTAGGITLIVSTVIALTLATWFGEEKFHHFWEQSLALRVSNIFEINLTWHAWINDGLMALFFFVVGLELKRQILVGELASIKSAALPVIAAIGGMVVPATIYAAINVGTPEIAGWGIPMATDIAFAIGILILLGKRIPKNLIIFLTALAIADDLGAVLAIAIFYSQDINVNALNAAAGLFFLLMILNHGGIRHPIPYIIVGILLWYAILISGIHATIAGVLLAMTIPARPTFTTAQFEKRITALFGEFRAEKRANTMDSPLCNDRIAAIAASVEKTADAVQTPLQKMEHSLTPWVTFLIIPIFALSNAGIDLKVIEWGNIFADKVTIGVMLGLVLGKFIGISLFSWIAVKTRIGQLPSNVQWSHLVGAAWLGGIGFTMSLFIGQLAFSSPLAIEQAKLGILLASLTSAIVGTLWLMKFTKPTEN